MNNETSQQTIQFCVLFQEQNINLHDKSIYQLPHIFYMVKHLHVYMVSIYMSYMIPFYMFCKLANLLAL